MAFDLHSNFSYSVVTIGPAPAASGTTLTLTSGQGALFPTPPFNAVAWPAGSPLPLASNAEIVRVSAKSGDTFTTIIRAQEGTSAQSIAPGYQVMAAVTAKTLTDIESTQQSGVGNYRGTWASGTTYAMGDSSSRTGFQYISTQSANTNHDPATDSSFTWWSPLVPTVPLLAAGDMIMGGQSSRAGCLLCDGASYATATYPALFNQIGYAYGGAGANFNVPLLQGRVPLGAGGAPALALGASGGAYNHTHSVPGLSIPALTIPALNITTGNAPTYTVAGHTHPLSSNGVALICPSTLAGVVVQIAAARSGSYVFNGYFTDWSVIGSGSFIGSQQGPLPGVPLTGNTDSAGGQFTNPVAGGTTSPGTASGTTSGAGASGQANPPYVTVNFFIVHG